ncbi:MAG TPA: hypothetical protein VK177_09725 [Flavobacteriales bacterium]|nr:hypothetical protein [Flavobacteriales bacterium]
MQPFDRNWLNTFHRQNSAIYRALPGTTHWNFEKMHNTLMQNMRQMQQNIIKVLNEPFLIPWQYKLQENDSTKKASSSKKGALIKTT